MAEIPSDDHRVRLGNAFSRQPSMWLALVAAEAGGLAICLGAVVLAHDPASRIIGAVLAVVLIVATLALVTATTELDTGAGTITRRVLGRGRPLSWRTARVSLETVRAVGGQRHLVVRDGRRRLRLQVVADDLGGLRNLPPADLRRLAEQIERHGTAPQVVAELRTLADAPGAAPHNPWR